MLEIRHLKTLHALRETDSLVEAAERLHLTQSALSHQFKELEERLGLQLFVRKTRPVRFTSAGLRLLQLAVTSLIGWNSHLFFTHFNSFKDWFNGYRSSFTNL